MPVVTFGDADVPVIRGSVTTPRGRRAFYAKMRECGSAAKGAGQILRAAKSTAKDASDQIDIASRRIKGNRDKLSTAKATTRATRKESAKKGGILFSYSFYKDPGYVEPPKTSSDLAVLKGVNFFDTYRSDVYRSLQDKDRYPIASIQVLSRRGGGKFGKNGFKTILPTFTKFFLESVSLQSSEKYQLALTFRSFRLFFFDANPEIWTFSGHLLNTENQNWLSEFRATYKQFLRGSECARRNAQCFLTFQDTAVSGVMLNTSSSLNAVSDKGVPFNFSLLVYNDSSFSKNSIVQVSQQLSYPRGAKDNPALLFEIMRNDFSRNYGSKERRGGELIVTSSRIQKMGTAAKSVSSKFTRRPSRTPGR